MTNLFDPIRFGDIELANRIVMAPMTRSRAECQRRHKRFGTQVLWVKDERGAYHNGRDQHQSDVKSLRPNAWPVD